VARLVDALAVAFLAVAALCFLLAFRLFAAKSDGGALYALALGGVATKAASEFGRRRSGRSS
jgi:hypothetical protein